MGKMSNVFFLTYSVVTFQTYIQGSGWCSGRWEPNLWRLLDLNKPIWGLISNLNQFAVGFPTSVCAHFLTNYC